MKITDTEVAFLSESNKIESEYSDEALSDAIIAWEYMREQKEVSIAHILETHRLLMTTRPCSESWKGALRTGKVWVGGKEKINWRKIRHELVHWTENVNDLVKNRKDTDLVTFLEDLIRTHHIVFEEIHPFFDGNGRIGRILYEWERLQVGLPIVVIKEADKQKYYQWFRE